MLPHNQKGRGKLTTGCKLVIDLLPPSGFICCQEFTSVLADELPPLDGLCGVQAPPFVGAPDDPQPHAYAPLRAPVRAARPAPAPRSALRGVAAAGDGAGAEVHLRGAVPGAPASGIAHGGGGKEGLEREEGVGRRWVPIAVIFGTPGLGAGRRGEEGDGGVDEVGVGVGIARVGEGVEERDGAEGF